MGNAPSDRGSVYAEDGETPRLYALAKIKPDQWPILYDPVYNITFAGMEKIHPFDSGKWGKIFKNLVGETLIYLRIHFTTLESYMDYLRFKAVNFVQRSRPGLHHLVRSLPLSSDPQ